MRKAKKYDSGEVTPASDVMNWIVRTIPTAGAMWVTPCMTMAGSPSALALSSVVRYPVYHSCVSASWFGTASSFPSLHADRCLGENAAIADDVRARDVGRRIRHQPDSGLSDLLGTRHPPDRDLAVDHPLHGRPLGFRDVHPHQPGMGRTGHDGIHPDPMPGVVEGHAPHQCGYASLGGAVGRCAARGEGDERGWRGRAYDRPAGPGRKHRPEGVLA